MILLSKTHHYSRCCLFKGAMPPSCSVFAASLMKDLIDFLSQISKLSYFNLFDLADFLMHAWIARFLFRCLM